jgi:hypothetical protein
LRSVSKVTNSSEKLSTGIHGIIIAHSIPKEIIVMHLLP